MNQYKPSFHPAIVIYKSPQFSKYIQQNEPIQQCPLKNMPTHDQEPNKKEIPSHQIEPQSLNSPLQKKYIKDDYQKNITINVVKCCIREMLSKNYEKILKKRCQRKKIGYQQLTKFIEPILKEVVISLGDLKKLLTSGDQQEIRLKSIFGWFLEWYLRHKYMYYLLNEGKMNYKQRYIEYKNKYILYLMEMIREERTEIAPIEKMEVEK